MQNLLINNLIKTFPFFFKRWFQPYYYQQKKPITGLFTGYYQIELKGSLVKTKRFNIPIYGIPDDLLKLSTKDFGLDIPPKTLYGREKNNQIIPYLSRKQINQIGVNQHLKPIAWTNDKLGRFFLEIQGSGVLMLPSNKPLYLGYGAQNGHAYVPIGSVLLKNGLIEKKNISLQSIKQYILLHPEVIDEILEKNPSFVFFKKQNKEHAIGAQNTALTPGYSLAVDKRWVPLGIPIWLDTSYPIKNNETKKQHVLQRMMFAQDTGGAIKGAVRGDVFWGRGLEAEYRAGHLKNQGKYWLLLPKSTVINTK